MLDATLCVLAGGESRRMGRPKALLEVGDGSLLAWIVGRLSAHFAETLVAAGSPDSGVPASPAFRLVYDLHRGLGPLAGIEAALAAARAETVFAVACDMPRVTPELAGLLVAAAEGFDAAVPRVAGRSEPACAAYRRSAAGPIAAALGGGRLRAGEVLAELKVRYLEEPELASVGASALSFANLNTPADYEEFLAGVRAQG